MLRNKMAFVGFTLALAVVLGACGKKVAKGSGTPSGANLTPTASAPVSDLEGSWKTISCISPSSDVNWTGKNEIHAVKITGNLLVETAQAYTDSSCSTKDSSAPLTFQSHFKVKTITDAIYKEEISYTDGDFVDFSEKVLVDTAGISFESEPNVFAKQ